MTGWRTIAEKPMHAKEFAWADDSRQTLDRAGDAASEGRLRMRLQRDRTGTSLQIRDDITPPTFHDFPETP